MAGYCVRRIGRCIYCGSTNGELTNEHIVPRSLGGTARLDAASCRSCQNAIGLFERRVTNEWLKLMRTVEGYPSYRKTAKRAVRISAIDEDVERDLQPAATPYLFLLPFYGERGPNVLSATNSAGHRSEVYLMAARLEYYQRVRELGVGSLRFRLNIIIPAFECMLGKIAYCSAVAQFGLENVASELPNLILAQDMRIFDYVGSSGRYDVARAHVYRAAFVNRESLATPSRACFVLSLFEGFASPAYTVYVGEILSNAQDIGHTLQRDWLWKNSSFQPPVLYLPHKQVMFGGVAYPLEDPSLWPAVTDMGSAQLSGALHPPRA